MATTDLSRIRATSRPAVPLPPLPKLVSFMTKAVLTKDDAGKFDDAMAQWWQRVQQSQQLNK